MYGNCCNITDRSKMVVLALFVLNTQLRTKIYALFPRLLSKSQFYKNLKFLAIKKMYPIGKMMCGLLCLTRKCAVW